VVRKMVDVIIVSHGAYAAGLREAAEMILGEQERVTVMGLYPGETREYFTDNLERVIDELATPKNTLILADLRSGTPFNASMMMVLKKGVTCVAGVNLTMLLEVLSARDERGIEEMASIAVKAGVEGIIDSDTLKLRELK